MPTQRIYPSEATYVWTRDRTETHSGVVAQALTTFAKGRGSSDPPSGSTIYDAVALLRFTRPQALKYAKITSASLTWVLEGYEGGGGAGYNYTSSRAYIATYTTDKPLSQISWSNYDYAGTQGAWVNVSAGGSYVTTPYTRTNEITALYSGDLSGSEITIAISAGTRLILELSSGQWVDWTYVTPSSCYLTVTYEIVPQAAPTPLYPRDTTIIESDTTLFTWQFNSETAAIQQAARLEWKSASEQSYTVVNLTQRETTYTLNEHLPVGTYEWRVKVTNDAGQTSDFSEVATFNVIGRPPAPIINDPDNKALTTLSWNTTDQQAVEIILQDQQGQQLLHESIATAETSYKPNIFLKGQYIVSVRVLNASSMWSEWSQKAFAISAEGPEAATFSILSAAGEPGVRIAYAIPQDTQAVLMRRVNGVEKILAELNDYDGEYVDNTVASDVEYEYFVRTYVDGYTDTQPRSTTVFFEGAIFSSEGEYLQLRKSDEQFLPYQETRERDYAVMKFSGREYAIVERGEHTNVELTRKFFVSQDDKPVLDELCTKETVFYRDNKRNAFPIAITRVQYDGFQVDGYILTVYFIRINEQEVNVNV